MSERDPDASLDAEFDRAHNIVLEHIFGNGVDDQIELASARMIEIARERGDRLMWAFVFARMDDYIGRGEPPPLPFLKGVSDAFTKFRSGVKSLDEAFGLSRNSKGRPVDLGYRLRARTQAELVTHYRYRGDTLDVAVEKAAEFKSLGGVSEAQVKRNYLKYRRRI